MRGTEKVRWHTGGICDRRKWYGKFPVPAASEKWDSICSGNLRKNDIDYPAAEALAVQVIAAEAYQDFEREHYEAAKQVMCACRKVICCQTVFESQNVLNRQLLQEAEDCGMEIELWQK